nr:STAS/SEC14 domain-containing protein [Mycobacterium sp. 1245805.9]
MSDLGWIRMPARSIGAWMPCPVRVYQDNERDDAVAWLNSLPGGADASTLDMAKAYIGGVSAAIVSLVKLAGTKLSASVES